MTSIVSIRSIIFCGGAPTFRMEAPYVRCVSTTFSGGGNENQNVVGNGRACIRSEQCNWMRIERSHNRHESKNIVA